jgi:hypothetical protein
MLWWSFSKITVFLTGRGLYAENFLSLTADFDLCRLCFYRTSDVTSRYLVLFRLSRERIMLLIWNKINCLLNLIANCVQNPYSEIVQKALSLSFQGIDV